MLRQTTHANELRAVASTQHTLTNHGAKYIAGFINKVKARITRSVWRSSYCLEIARQDHADARHLWRQAGCCIGLSFIRMMGGGL